MGERSAKWPLISWKLTDYNPSIKSFIKINNGKGIRIPFYIFKYDFLICLTNIGLVIKANHINVKQM